MTQRIRYGTTPGIPPGISNSIQSKRIIQIGTPKRSARPAATPATIRWLRDRYNPFEPDMVHPSRARARRLLRQNTQSSYTELCIEKRMFEVCRKQRGCRYQPVRKRRGLRVRSTFPCGDERTLGLGRCRAPVVIPTVRFWRSRNDWSNRRCAVSNSLRRSRATSAGCQSHSLATESETFLRVLRSKGLFSTVVLSSPHHSNVYKDHMFGRIPAHPPKGPYSLR